MRHLPNGICQTAFAKKNLLKLLSSKSRAKFLVKSTPGVNFINILRARCSYESALHSFSLVTLWLLRSTKALLYEKCGRKMLMKLTPERKEKE